LQRFIALLSAAEDDPKAQVVERLLLKGETGKGWLTEGCIIFSQYYDSVRWLADRLSRLLPEESIGIYVGASRSGLLRAGEFIRLPRDEIKAAVRRDELRLVIGTDAASEGLNLQRLGTLINLDLPWNPTRLEQRKGRIQRIGQVRDEVLIYNLRYRGSVEDRVHELLSARQESIYSLFGQLPDTLEDVWVQVALRNEEKAKQIIDAVPETHPFEIRYDRVETINWESCAKVLDLEAQTDVLFRGWNQHV
jgi:SNF2 family DNA or RNA helicase